MVSTSSGKILAVQVESFNTPDPENPSGSELLVDTPDSCLSHILAHPLRPELMLLATPNSCTSSAVAAGSSGTAAAAGSSSKQQASAQGQKLVPTQRLQRWDLAARCCLVSRQLPPEQVAVQVALARDGAFVVLGCAAGQVAILKGDTLQETVALRHTKHDITRWAKCCWGQCSALLASRLAASSRPVECCVHCMQLLPTGDILILCGKLGASQCGWAKRSPSPSHSVCMQVECVNRWALCGVC